MRHQRTSALLQNPDIQRVMLPMRLISPISAARIPSEMDNQNHHTKKGEDRHGEDRRSKAGEAKDHPGLT